MDFHKFAQLVHARFNAAAAGELFRTEGLAGVDIKDVYLGAFPEGTNPIYLTNTEHDCSCCKHFLRGLGTLVAIKDGVKTTIWDVEGLEYPYDIVAKALHEHVMARRISGLFLTTPDLVQFGTEQNNQTLADGSVRVWKHFHGRVPAHLVKSDAGAIAGKRNTNFDTLYRALTTLSADAAKEVVKMIDDPVDQLYRGKEYRESVIAFLEMQEQFKALPDDAAKTLFLWTNSNSYVSGFRSTAIGKLVEAITDIDAAGREDELEYLDMIENAVKQYELWVDPTRKNHSSAAISPKMVEAAMAKIRALDLEPALERRMANLRDLSVNNVLWVDGNARAQLKGGLQEMLMASTKTPEVKTDTAIDIAIDDFLRDVLPMAKSMEALVQGRHQNNLVTVTAPVHENVQPIFKWDSGFAWAYRGNLTDSIRDRVKAAGGNVANAQMRVSLAWYNTDDLDLHVIDPFDDRIYFNNRRGFSQGVLDVDMNAHYKGNFVRDAVENISWASRPTDGLYKIFVDNYQRRESTDTGLEIEIESDGKIDQYHFEAPRGIYSAMMVIEVRAGKIVNVSVEGPHTQKSRSKEIWGVKTETFTKVKSVILSPNFWDNHASGNKHWFFLLDGAKADEPVNGVFNEFLRSDLREHRKVFQVIGAKTQVPVVDDQLTGVGFSETVRAEVILKVTSESQVRLYNVKF